MDTIEVDISKVGPQGPPGPAGSGGGTTVTANSGIPGQGIPLMNLVIGGIEYMIPNAPDLTNYVTQSQLTAAGYVTSTNVSDTLASYITMNNLNTTLGAYVTISALNSAGYITEANQRFTVDNMVKLAGIAAMADVTPSWVPSTNPNYLPSANLVITPRTGTMEIETITLSGVSYTVPAGSNPPTNMDDVSVANLQARLAQIADDTIPYSKLTGEPTIPTVPTTLPNPNALTFTGAATGTYDGSAALTIDIPMGGSGGGTQTGTQIIDAINATGTTGVIGTGHLYQAHAESVAGDITLDFTNTDFHYTLTGNITLRNPASLVDPIAKKGNLIFIQDATGGRTITLPSTGSNYLTPGGAGLPISTTPNSISVVPYYILSSTQILLGIPAVNFS